MKMQTQKSTDGTLVKEAFFDLDVITVRVHKAYELDEFCRYCDFLPVGSLVRYTQPSIDFSIDRWQELGVSSRESSDNALSYMASSGLRGPLKSNHFPNGAQGPQNYSNGLENIVIGSKTIKIWWRTYKVGRVVPGTTMMLLGYLKFPWAGYHSCMLTMSSPQWKTTIHTSDSLETAEEKKKSTESITDRYIQIWQPISEPGSTGKDNIVARNLYTSQYEVLARGTLDVEPYFECYPSANNKTATNESGRSKNCLRFDVADKFLLSYQQPESVREAILGKDYKDKMGELAVRVVND